MSTAAEIAELLAERDPNYRKPPPEAIAAMQAAIDAAAARLTATKARELARLWHQH